jgi:UDP-N-acetylmuramate--alanine ligase
VNVENAVAAVAMLWAAAKAENRPLDITELRAALNEFSGVKRRFEFYVNTPKQVYMDDYAHHPRELGAAISSVRAMFPTRHLTALFQPHLYTRTRDLCDGFAEALSMADEVVLLPIYPARELPIEGVTAELIAERLTAPYRIVELDALADEVAAMTTDVVVSFGAGSIDRKTAELAAVAEAKSH